MSSMTITQALEYIDAYNRARAEPERDAQKWLDEHQTIIVEKRFIPKGAKLVEAYETDTEIVVLGFPDENDETHNCDAMGCSTFSHVMYRFRKEVKP